MRKRLKTTELHHPKIKMPCAGHKQTSKKEYTQTGSLSELPGMKRHLGGYSKEYDFWSRVQTTFYTGVTNVTHFYLKTGIERTQGK